ncbi:hypothetical protein Q8F55_001229 [Vanrija albida]|uniref:Small-subunit processome Utp12 domain-containing protein n=1 Tax=Vanrija albida TaxID=181172 RepID=A0ABR3QGI6_9TREE
MASISAPTSLATFPYAHASSSRVPHVTLNPVHGSRSRLAVAAVHGDGVWTYDIKTLKPTTSFTVPPSTVFATAPVSFVPPAGEDDAMDGGERVTAVGVHSGDGVRGEARALWVWCGDEGERKTVALETAVHSLHPTAGGWPLVAVGADGALALVSSDLTVSPLARKDKAARTLAAAVVGRRVAVVDQRGRARVYTIDGDRAELALDVALVPEHGLLAADINDDGVITAIDTLNRVHSRRVADLESARAGDGVPLAHPSTPAVALSLPVLSATPGRALAAIAVPSPSPTVALVVPSPELPAVLASTAISTAAATGITHLAVLARPGPTHIVLGMVLAHPDAGSATAGRSVIHVSDIHLPPNGVGLSLLVGNAAKAGAVFSLPGASSLPQLAEKMVDAVTAALGDADVERAEKAFAAWLEAEDKSHGPKAKPTEAVVRRLITAVFSTALPKKDKADKEVEAVPAAAAPKGKLKAPGPYAGKIVSTLVDRRVVTDAMWPGGLILAGLVPAGDWRSISELVKHSPALPSRTLVALLALSLEPSPAVALGSVLQDVLAGPQPDPSYRAHLRTGIDGKGALRILEHLAKWAEVHADLGDGLSAWPQQPQKIKPTLDAVVAHSSLLLDAQLPTLITLPESEKLLTRLNDALAPALAAQQNYRRLLAPIDATLAANAKAQRKAKEEAAAAAAAARNQGKGKPPGGRKPVVAGPGLADEVVGKWKVEDFVF